MTVSQLLVHRTLGFSHLRFNSLHLWRFPTSPNPCEKNGPQEVTLQIMYCSDRDKRILLFCSRNLETLNSSSYNLPKFKELQWNAAVFMEEEVQKSQQRLHESHRGGGSIRKTQHFHRQKKKREQNRAAMAFPRWTHNSKDQEALMVLFISPTHLPSPSHGRCSQGSRPPLACRGRPR